MAETGAPSLQSMAYERIADLYDAYVTADFDIPFFVQAAGQTAGPVLELMSGTGRVSVSLAEAGVRLTCVDNSPAMLAVLRQKLAARDLHAAVHCMDVRELALPGRYELIVIPFNAFCELVSPADQRAALACIRGCLAGGGRFICTLHNGPVRLKQLDGQLHLAGRYRLAASEETLLGYFMHRQAPEPGTVEGVNLYELYDAAGVMRAKRLFEVHYCLHSY